MSAPFRSRWLDWTPEDFEKAPTPAPAKPSKPGSAGFAGDHLAPVLEIRGHLSAPPSQPIRPPAEEPVTCFSCWGSDFWQGTGALVCRRCHPPAPGAEVPSLARTGSDASGPVEINVGSTAEPRTHGVRGGAA